ncbi:hypothetical protein TWF694_007274 [Orbilia ellipsospora]|uniref:Uncharacterized protein n=1 Tax=Orbilia ellipsospora TaxID=2528407 RepID=A0AAV9XH76_9PEZI
MIRVIVLLFLFLSQNVIAVRSPPARNYEYPQADPIVEPPHWRYPPDLIVNATSWENFIKPPQGGMLEDPTWYLLYSGYLLREFSRMEENMAILLGDLTSTSIWGYYNKDYFRKISPLTTEWYVSGGKEINKKLGLAKKVPCIVDGEEQVNTYRERVKYHPFTDKEPGIMDCGGPLDTSAKRDNPRSGDFSLDKIAVRKILENLFSARYTIKDGNPVVELSQTGFLAAWKTVRTVFTSLSAFVPEIVEYTQYMPDTEIWELNFDPNVDVRRRQTRLFEREVIGYEEYFDGKYGGMATWTSDLVADPNWMARVVDRYEKRLHDTSDPFALYGVIVTTVCHGILPLMLEMFADIATKANDMARENANIETQYLNIQLQADLNWGTISNPVYYWGLPDADDAQGMDEATLKNWPEWANNRYMIEAWPVPETQLRDAIRKISAEKVMEEGINANNPFPWRGSVRFETMMMSDSEIYLP